MLRVSRKTTKLVPVEVLRLRISGMLSADGVAAGFRCSACRQKLGGRRFGTAWIRDSGGERSLRLCWDCTLDALESCPDVEGDVDAAAGKL